MKRQFVLILITFTSLAHAAFHGDVDKVNNSPGYIDLNPKSDFYRGINTSPKTMYGAERRTPSQIVASYFNQGVIDSLKLQQFIHTLEDYKENIKISTCMEELRESLATYKDCQDNIKSKKFAKKWKKNKFRKALNLAIENLEVAKKSSYQVTEQNINRAESQDFLERLFNTIEIYEAIKAEDEQRGKYSNVVLMLLQAKEAIFGKDYIKSNRMDAANLVLSNNKQSNSLFYSQQMLEDFKAQGGDISKLDPPSNGFWRKPVKSIREFDTTNYDKQGLKQLKELLPKQMIEKFMDKDEVIDVIYKPHFIKGGKTAKFNVYLGKSKWKLKFITDRHGYAAQRQVLPEIAKYVQGSEVNVEPVVNNLAAALGFTVDPTYYKKKVRLYFEDEVYKNGEFDKYLEDLKTNVSERFFGFNNTDSAFTVVKTDSNGKKYLEMKSVTLESKSDKKTDMNIGFFVRDGVGKTLKREHRGFYTFLAWIGDPDIKDDNDKVKIVPYTKEDGTSSYKVMLSNSDMGAALGFGFPNYYNTNFVKSTSRNKTGELNSLRLGFLRIFPYNLSKSVNIDDAKWMARRIAQLSFNQIEKAYTSAGMPEVVAKYYTLLMLRKRNQLIKALNMFGESFKDDGGKQYTITKAPEFTGTIEGYEEYFRNGHLTDKDNKLFNPEVENFVRNWGVSWRNRNLDIPQKSVIKTLRVNLIESLLRFAQVGLFDRTMLTRTGPRFFNVRVFDRELGQACQNNCFMEGLDFGVSHFIPMRYLVQNPDETSDKPYWVVDMFRVGAYIGDNGAFLQSIVGADIPSPIRVGAGVRLYKVVEFMKIHPTKDINSYYKDPKNLLKLPKNLRVNHRKIVVDSMSEGDSLIVSDYIGQAASIRTRFAKLNPFGGVRLGFENINMGRMTIHKGENNLTYANWGAANSLNTGIEINAVDMLLRLPLVKATYEKLKSRDHSYIFDLNNSEENKILMSNLKSTVPRDIPLKYLTQERIKSKSEVQLLATLFGLVGKKSYRRRVQNEFYDYTDERTYKDKIFEIEKEKLKLANFVSATENKTSIAYLNNDNQINLGFKLKVTHPVLEKPDFLRMMKKYQRLLPDDLISFDHKFIKHYMGAVEIDMNVFFNKNALDKFFLKEKKEVTLCEKYAVFLKQNDPVKSCGFTNGRSYKVKKYFRSQFKALWRKYKKARANFHLLADQTFENSRFKNLKKLAKFMMDKNQKLSIVEFMISISEPKDFKRNASIDSELYAFPGDIRLIEQSNFESGQMQEVQYDSMKLFTDEIHSAVEPFFYNIMHRL